MRAISTRRGNCSTGGSGSCSRDPVTGGSPVATDKRQVIPSSLRRGLFTGRDVLVVGGTGSIGAAVAARFAELGGSVVVAGLPDPGVDSPTGITRTVRVDVASADDVLDLLAQFDGLDVLVNCAGIIGRDQEYSEDGFARVLDVNLSGTMRTSLAALPALTARGGSIINTASMLSYVGGPHAPAYSASKAGVVALTRSLAVRFAPDGVRVNAIAPGWIRTGFTAAVRADPAMDRRIIDRTPMGRWGEPGDLTDTVAFLAGPGARFITGTVVAVDGGYLAA